MLSQNNIKSKKVQTLFFLFLLLSACIAIVLNIPVYRQILGVSVFFTLPGLLIIGFLKLNISSISKRIVFSFGLSYFFVTFIALTIDYLYPLLGYDKPLTVMSLTFTYGITIALLLFGAYYRKISIITYSISDQNVNLFLDRRIISPLVISAFFPIISIVGSIIMNNYSNNTLLILLPILVMIYLILLIFMQKQVHPAIYPCVIFFISLAIALVHPLRGIYPVVGSDSFLEIHAISSTVKYFKWNTGSFDDPVIATLSTGLFSPVVRLLLGLKTEVIYRFIGPFLMSIIPLGLFTINKDYFGHQKAFIISIFIASQYSFIYNIGSRVQIGWFFLSLVIMVLLDRELTGFSTKIIFLMFLLSLVVSYYTYSYLFSFILICVSVFTYISSRCLDVHVNSKTSINTIFILICTIFFWWGQLTNAHFNQGIFFLEKTLSSLAELAIFESREELGRNALGIGLTGWGDIINAITFYVTSALIFIGVLSCLYSYIKHQGKKQEVLPLYLFLMLPTLLIWVSAIVAPFISEGFGIDRAYYFGIPILAPGLIIGTEFICNQKILNKIHYKNRKLLSITIVLLVIMSHLFVSFGLTWQIFGTPKSVLINDEGAQYDIWYIHLEEVTVGRFILNHGNNAYTVYGDAYSANRFTPLLEEERMFNTSNKFFKDAMSLKHAYVFLRCQNVLKGEIVPWYVRKIKDDQVPIIKFSSLLRNQSKIYDNSCAEIYLL